MKKINNKKTLVILLVLCIGVVGITIAYFSNSTTIDNLFSTKEYGTTYTETFVSPDNWLPGDTTDKTVTVTNSGSVDEAVRISLTEEWMSNNGTTLSGLIDEFGKLTDVEENSEKAAIINFSNTDDWTYNNGYYYYNYRLKPNETTSSFIESVTFNPKVTLGDNCTETESNGKKTITCNSSGEDYDNATYKLTLTIETVQYNKYMNFWNTDVAILEEQALFCDAFEVGEVVDYNGSEYYVLKDSSTSDDYVTLLKKDPLIAEEVNQYSDSYVSQDGEYPYYESDACNENIQTGCSTNYDTSDVKKIVDRWSSSFSDDLVSVDGYKTRLVNYDDLFNILNYVEKKLPSSTIWNNTVDTPKWVYIDNMRYWSTIKYDDYDDQLLNVGQSLLNKNVYDKFYIRPVINIKKNIINHSCSFEHKEYLYCNFGDEVIYNNEKYYVIEESDNTKKHVTLLKSELLTLEEVNQYSDSYVSQDGEYPYYENDSCNENNQTYCNNNFDTSNIKRILDNWSSGYNNLVNIDGYRVRLIRYNELLNNLGYRWMETWPVGYRATEVTPTWGYFPNKSYWAINDIQNYLIGAGYTMSSENAFNKLYVRPVINLKKDAIESGCHVGNKNNDISYEIGETINYKNSNYCVIKSSAKSDTYVTLIKQDPLTYDELVTYNNGYNISRDILENNIGITKYFNSETCNSNSNSNCNNDYEISNIRSILNNWSSQFNNDLKIVNGYKVRLITSDELNSMGHIFYLGTAHAQVHQKSEYDCLYSNADYWTMSNTGDSQNEIDIVSKVDNNNKSQKVYDQYAVRPVINLKKCAIDNTCE